MQGHNKDDTDNTVESFSLPLNIFLNRFFYLYSKLYYQPKSLRHMNLTLMLFFHFQKLLCSVSQDTCRCPEEIHLNLFFLITSLLLFIFCDSSPYFCLVSDGSPPSQHRVTETLFPPNAFQRKILTQS